MCYLLLWKGAQNADCVSSYLNRAAILIHWQTCWRIAKSQLTRQLPATLGWLNMAIFGPDKGETAKRRHLYCYRDITVFSVIVLVGILQNKDREAGTLERTA